MKPERPPAMLVIGVGNRYRRDDGVGIAVAGALQAKRLANITIREESGEGASLIEAWQEASVVVIVDATRSGSAPGTIHRLDATQQVIPARFFHYSTHAFSVAEAVELARALNQLPPRLIIYGVEGEDFESGQELSSQVAKAVPEVVERIIVDNGLRETSQCLISSQFSGRVQKDQSSPQTCSSQEAFTFITLSGQQSCR